MKVWKKGDRISYEKLNELQRKADAYDKLQELKKAKAKKNK